MPGLLYNGKLIQVPGLEIISPGDQPWARLSSEDFGPRPSQWIRQITLHTTKGKWPQHVKPGAGAGGKDKAVADWWIKDKNHSAAQLVVDNDGSIACLCDLKYAAWHNSNFKLNQVSIGIEMYQEADGGIYEAVLESTVKLVLALCDIFGIPLQGALLPYRNAPIRRMELGDTTVVGVYGHRDITHSRGYGDPGEEILNRLVKAGMIRFDIQAKKEIEFWKRVQNSLNSKYGLKLTCDGICGPGTVKALRDLGLWNGGVFLESPA
jgi:hypothetical protein